MSKDKYVFIDAENMRNAVEIAGFLDLDYAKLCDWLINTKQAKKIFIYVGIIPGDKEKEDRYSQLKSSLCLVNCKQVVSHRQKNRKIKNTCPNCSHIFVRKHIMKDKKKANCDVDLTMDIIKNAIRGNFKEVVIFSGDGDFVPAYKYLVEKLHKEVVIYAPSDRGKHKRTARVIKELNKTNIIKWEDVFGLLPKYGLAKNT